MPRTARIGHGIEAPAVPEVDRWRQHAGPDRVERKPRVIIDLGIDRDEERIDGGRDDAAPMQVIRSCNDTWLIDPGRKRFCRVPRSAPVSFLAEVGHWEPYERLEIDA